MESYNHLITLEKPDEETSQPSKVYIDSVKKITENNEDVLLISGTFPDACTKLEDVIHKTKNDSLHLELTAWRNPDKMCAQVLTPFTYIYDRLSDEELTSHTDLIVNGTPFSIQ